MLPLLLGFGGGTIAFFGRVFLVGVIVDFIIKVLVGLGLGIASYYLGSWGLDSLFNTLKANLNGAPVAALQLAQMGGFSEALSILFGALSIRIAMSGLKKSRFIFSPTTS